MIEFPITLTSGGSVCLPGRAYALALGYTKNRGVYRLAVTASGEWEGLAIRCFWHVPDGKDPASSLVDGYVDVPASVTAQPGSGCITFEGSDGAKVMTSADLRYRVSANSGTEDGTEPEPGTPAWQQLVDAVHADATAAEQAKTDAQTAASEAATSAGNADQSAQKAAGSLQALKDGIAAGDFKGEPGNDGKSPVVTVTDIENGHRVSITDKDGTKTIDVLNGQTGKTGATPVLTIGTVSSGDKPSADITGTPENPVLNLRLQPGPQGPAVALDTTLTHEGEAADAKATGDAISAVKVRQNVLTGSEIGNPIAVDDAFAAPLCGLTVYGRSTQSGTPTLDAPVPIVSAGDGGSVAVKVTGKNLIPTNCGQNTTALRYDAQYNRWVFDALKAVGLVNARIIDPETARYLLAAGTYTITLVSSENVQNVIISAVNVDWKTLASVAPGSLSKTFSVNANTIVGCYFVPTDVNATGYLQVQLELGSTATAYSPYREQLLTLLTPNGLPGIPVTSGGNYTDSTGQQWVCDEVDLERGVRVQRVYKVDVDGENAKFVQAGDYANLVPRGIPIALYNQGQKIYATSTFTNLSWFYNTVNGQFLYLIAANLADQLNASCKKQLGKVYYALATPIEKPLTSDELDAYKAIVAYGPDTVVQAGDGAGVKLDYQRDVNLVVKNLEDAIASMT